MDEQGFSPWDEQEERTPPEEEEAAVVAEAPAEAVDTEKVVEMDGKSEPAPTTSGPTNTKAEESAGLNLVASARSALNKCDRAIVQLNGALRRKIHLLDEGHLQDLQDAHTGGFEDDILDSWVEELLRFLVLKTLQGDLTRPCQQAPSGPVTVAWRALLAMPSTYVAVCHAMGNARPIEEDIVAWDVALKPDEERQITKRLNATMRAYTKFFDEQPPTLFWSGVQEPREPNPLVQVYRTAKQLWSGMAHCGSDALETVNGFTGPKAAMDAFPETNDILMDEANADCVDASSVHANPFVTAE
jgi:hypothetical protein